MTNGLRFMVILFSLNALASVPDKVIVGQSINGWTQGTLRETDVQTDIAISGAGFIPLKNFKGEMFYTRNGSLRMNERGELVHMLTGFNVVALNEKGSLMPINLRGKGTKVSFNQTGRAAILNTVTINNDGIIIGLYSDGKKVPLAKLTIALVENPRRLKAVDLEKHLLKATNKSGEVAYVGVSDLPLAKIYGKYLEDLPKSLYEANFD